MNPCRAAGGELIAVFDLVERLYPLDVLLRVKFLHASTSYDAPPASRRGNRPLKQQSELTLYIICFLKIKLNNQVQYTCNIVQR